MERLGLFICSILQDAAYGVQGTLPVVSTIVVAADNVAQPLAELVACIASACRDLNRVRIAIQYAPAEACIEALNE